MLDLILIQFSCVWDDVARGGDLLWPSLRMYGNRCVVRISASRLGVRDRSKSCQSLTLQSSVLRNKDRPLPGGKHDLYALRHAVCVCCTALEG
jgi:hypothetical protein